MTLFEDDAGRHMRVRAVVAYDGSGFSGFAAQPSGPPTVGGTLAEAIGRVLGHHVDLTCAGRTDAGVHGWGQVVSFDADAERFDPDGLRRAVNKLLRPAIVLREVTPAAPDFDARFSARSRRYRYTILNQATPSPFLAGTAWWIDRRLDLAAMRLACDPLIGEHDFSSFCRAGPIPPNRRVRDAGWSAPEPDIARFEITADGFCQQMVRSLVGTFVEVGRGKLKAGDVGAIVRARDRATAPPVAPPDGLVLHHVRYD